MTESPLYLWVKVIPRSSEACFRGRMADGSLKIALRSPPVEGRANSELEGFLAEQFGTGRSSVHILSGRNSRRKLVRIDHHGSLPAWYGRLP